MIRVEDLNLKKLEEVHHIWLAIMKMDIYRLESLLDESIDYEDVGKTKFIEKINNRFNHHRSLGDNELYLDLVKCNGCKNKENVCRFLGNSSNQSFALYFESKDNQISDIFHCTWYGDMDFLSSF